MTHKEYLQRLIKAYSKSFAQSSAMGLTDVSLREGIAHAWKFAFERWGVEGVTPIAYLKDLVKIYEEAFTKESSEDPKVNSFREGMLFAWNLAIYGLDKEEN